MEDNNAINEQSTTVNNNVNVEELLKMNEKLQAAAEHWYNQVKRLENSWLLSKLDFLFKFVKLDDISDEYKQEALEEIHRLLLPKVENKNNKSE